MKYLCLIYVDEKKLAQMSADEMEAVARECAVHTEALSAAGRYIAGERLESVDVATTVRHANGKPIITDGPFAETREQLAGFYLIDAPDLDEAIRIAEHIPPGRLGCIEVRPVMADKESTS